MERGACRRTLFIAPILSEGLFAGIIAALDGKVPGGASALFYDMACSRFTEPSQWENWTLDTEVAAIELLRQRSEIGELNLVGYSGGAAVALAYAAAHPEVLGSLALLEPPWIGNDPWSEEEVAFCNAYERLGSDPIENAWEIIASALNAPSTPLPPAPPIEPQQLKTAFWGVWRGYRAAALDRNRLRVIGAPVYLPIGEGSAPRMHAQAENLASSFTSAHVEMIEGASHFDLPMIGQRQLADGLRRLWTAAVAPARRA
jgi:pimeloyl-ACP methyl ester carboxylesterase